MKCPGCKTEMTAMTLEARMGGQVAIDVCAGCQAFWFDHFESLKLSPAPH
jgi:Zn-finger nucleic acid-binding protein